MQRKHPSLRGRVRVAARATALVLLAAVSACARRPSHDMSGINPHPVRLVRPAAGPLSPVAQLGQEIFVDPGLSASGTISCATCHSPGHAFGPPNDLAVQPGGKSGHDQGSRAAPSLRYLDRVPDFSIGPENATVENVKLMPTAARAADVPRTRKAAGSAAAGAMVPQGGLFWDGRVHTLQQQAAVPLFNPVEMANASAESVAGRLRRAAYGPEFVRLFGAGAIATPQRLVDEAMFAVARFQVEDPAFHPYDSKYDAYLEGRAALSPAESRGLAVFEDPGKGNCAGCHLDQPAPDGMPPAFTDYQYEALGVPRNTQLLLNRDPAYFDLGLCGPIRTDLAALRQYCGMFRTPSLRNVATRKVFFHNGVYHTLADVLRFYNLRDVDPAAIFPAPHHGAPLSDRFNDLPTALRGNVDTLDAPFGRRRGAAPPMTEAELDDLIALLGTLTDGYPR
ncbi:MAG: cytochrome-c peroxidase [Gemmatimonadales bacterium]